MEKMAEFNMPLWVAAIDFQKAFDTVEHDSIWQSLMDAEVPAAYIRTLAALYSKQQGVVVGEKISKPFEIQRGTKQGDPLSPAIFNAVLEMAFVDLVPKWRARRCGVLIGPLAQNDRLCNLRFADDVLLVATSKRQLTIMLAELMEAVSKLGLVLHAGKTKILTNVTNENSDYIIVKGQEVEGLKKEQSTMYLGWSLSLEATQDTEIQHRINRGWAKFMSLKNELCCRRY